jgi:hypothetical protein
MLLWQMNRSFPCGKHIRGAVHAFWQESTDDANADPRKDLRLFFPRFRLLLSWIPELAG